MRTEEIIKNFYGDYLISIKKIDDVYEDKYGKWIGLYEVQYYDIDAFECNDKWYQYEKNDSIFYVNGPDYYSEYYYKTNKNDELKEIGVNGLLYYLGRYDEVICLFKKYEKGIFYLKIMFTDKVIKVPLNMIGDKTIEKTVKLGDIFTKNEIEKLLE